MHVELAEQYEKPGFSKHIATIRLCLQVKKILSTFAADSVSMIFDVYYTLSFLFYLYVDLKIGICVDRVCGTWYSSESLALSSMRADA